MRPQVKQRARFLSANRRAGDATNKGLDLPLGPIPLEKKRGKKVRVRNALGREDV